MVDELKEVNSQGCFGYDDDNFLWIIFLILILCFCNGGNFFGGCGGFDNNWIYIIIIALIFFCCCGNKGFGNLFGGFC